jgi:hypothetical protein
MCPFFPEAVVIFTFSVEKYVYNGHHKTRADFINVYLAFVADDVGRATTTPDRVPPPLPASASELTFYMRTSMFLQPRYQCEMI